MSITLLAFCIVVNQTTAQSAISTTDQIDALFDQWDSPDSPGAAIAVIKDGRVLYKNGYGMASLEYDVPITPATIFDIASVSKQFGAMAIALLVEAGKLSLDDDIRTYIPEVPDFGKPITIRHLVHHTSGIRDWPGTLAIGGWRMDDIITFEQILGMIWKQKALNFEPGDQYSYSNSGYNLLAETVARVTGQSFREWTKENLFTPLGMSDTHFHDDHQMVVKNRAQAYRKEGDNYKNIPNGLTALASSSLYTSIDDLVKWVINFEDGAVGGLEVQKLLHQRGTLNNGEEIAYAFGNSISEYRGIERISHSGGWAGFNTYLVRFPSERFSIIVLSNAGDLGARSRAYEIADLYLKELIVEEESLVERDIGEPVIVEKNQLNKYVGDYRLGLNWYVNITLDETGLMTQATNEPKFKMTPVSQTRFWVEAYGAHIEFKGADSDEATHFEYRGIHAPRVEKISQEQIPFTSYEGKYYSEELETTYTVVERDGMLKLVHMRHGTISLEPIVKDIFQTDRWFMGEVEFIRDSDGKVTEFSVSNFRSRNIKFIRI